MKQAELVKIKPFAVPIIPNIQFNKILNSSNPENLPEYEYQGEYEDMRTVVMFDAQFILHFILNIEFGWIIYLISNFWQFSSCHWDVDFIRFKGFEKSIFDSFFYNI